MTLIAFPPPPHFIFNIDFSGKLDFRTFCGSTVIFFCGAQSLFLRALLDLITPPPHFVLHYTYVTFFHATDFFFVWFFFFRDYSSSFSRGPLCGRQIGLLSCELNQTAQREGLKGKRPPGETAFWVIAHTIYPLADRLAARETTGRWKRIDGGGWRRVRNEKSYSHPTRREK